MNKFFIKTYQQILISGWNIIKFSSIGEEHTLEIIKPKKNKALIDTHRYLIKITANIPVIRKQIYNEKTGQIYLDELIDKI